MRALLDFLKDLFKAITAPASPWPERSHTRCARRDC